MKWVGSFGKDVRRRTEARRRRPPQHVRAWFRWGEALLSRPSPNLPALTVVVILTRKKADAPGVLERDEGTVRQSRLRQSIAAPPCSNASNTSCIARHRRSPGLLARGGRLPDGRRARPEATRPAKGREDGCAEAGAYKPRWSL